jgi:hypothetical protein
MGGGGVFVAILKGKVEKMLRITRERTPLKIKRGKIFLKTIKERINSKVET